MYTIGIDETNNIEYIIGRAVQEALKQYDDRKRKDGKSQVKKKVFHNTDMLLKNYNSLVEHYKNSIYDLESVEMETVPIKLSKEELREDELYIESIRKNKIRTLIMINHIDAAMKNLKEKLDRKGQSNKYDVIKLLYLEGKEYKDIAEELHCDERTIRRWKEETINELSIYLFGIDGLKLEI